jgi:hypothetical protein
MRIDDREIVPDEAQDSLVDQSLLDERVTEGHAPAA